MSSVVEPFAVAGLGGEQNARSEASQCRRNSTPVISLDFSDAMCAVEICGDEAMDMEMTPWTASGTIRALLVVFDLSCPSEEDCAVSRTNLEKVLRRQLCSDSDDHIHSMFETLSAASNCNCNGDDRIDFFSYWQSMDLFFNERGIGFQAGWDTQQLDVVEGARQLREQVLATYNGAVSQESPVPELLTVVLESCIDDECRREDLVNAFLEHGMTLPQFGGMIYACLKKHFEVSQGDDSSLWDLEDKGVFGGNLSPSRRKSSSTASESAASPGGSQRRKSSLASDPDETTPIHELGEIVERSLAKNDRAAQSAIGRIMQRYESMASKMKQQQDAIHSMEEDMSLLDKQRGELQAELLQAREVCEDVEDWKRECEKHKQRAAAFEKQVSEIEEQSRSASQSLNSLQLEHRETSREYADCQRRYTQLQEYCDRLESSAFASEEKMKELEEVTKHAERRSQMLSNELDKQSFHSNLAKVLQKRCSKLPSVEEKPANVECIASNKEPSDTSTTPGLDEVQTGSSEVALLKEQLAVQQTQLQSLRAVRNELFTAHDTRSAEPNQSKLLGAQLRAMLQHTQQLETLLDKQSTCGMATTLPNPQEQFNHHVVFSANLAEQLAAQIGNEQNELYIEEPCSPGMTSTASNEGKNGSPARASTVSTAVSSGKTGTRASIDSTSASSASMNGEGEHGDNFLLSGSRLEVQISPKKKLLDNAKNVMRAQRFGNALKVPESSDKRDRRRTTSPSSTEKPSNRSRYSVVKTDGRTKVEQQEQDSWMPSLSGWFTSEQDEDSTDDEEHDKKDHRRSRNTAHSASHSAHRHRRSEMVVRR